MITNANADERITRVLAEWKAENGKTNADVASALGVSESTLRRRMSGESQWLFMEATKAASLTGCKLIEFVA